MLFWRCLFDSSCTIRQVQKSANFYWYVCYIYYSQIQKLALLCFRIFYDTPQRQRRWQSRKQNNILWHVAHFACIKNEPCTGWNLVISPFLFLRAAEFLSMLLLRTTGAIKRLAHNKHTRTLAPSLPALHSCNILPENKRIKSAFVQRIYTFRRYCVCVCAGEKQYRTRRSPRRFSSRITRSQYILLRQAHFPMYTHAGFFCALANFLFKTRSWPGRKRKWLFVDVASSSNGKRGWNEIYHFQFH